jgi:death-on-curing protein
VANEIVWIASDAVRRIHEEQIGETGGIQGIRDTGLLESALSRPHNLLGYLEPPPDLVDLAAAYAFGITRNHPFLDGNKRTAYIVMRTFLLINGKDIVASEDDRYDTFIRLAASELTEADLADWIREHLNAEP